MTTDNDRVDDSLGVDRENKIERMVRGDLSGDVQTAFGALKGVFKKDPLIKREDETKEKE